MENKYIVIKGAKVHNLKNIDVKIPRNKLVVVTGLSGSGKSSLAFDTVYAEGQRRYVESLSSYARQFLEQIQKPDVEHIEGISPSIAIQQRTAGGNPRSTVATQTEIYDYFRLLFARIGRPHCYKCGKLITRQSQDQIVEKILSMPKGANILILAPVVRGRKGEYRELFSKFKKEGFLRVRVDKKIYELGQEIKLDKNKKHDIEIMVDRLQVDSGEKKRLNDSVETALKFGSGLAIISELAKRSPKDTLFSQLYSCVDCDISMGEIEPRMFSFNSPYGACPKCGGLGTKMEFDLDLVIPDKSKGIEEGAIEPWKRGGHGYIMYYRGLLREFASIWKFSLDEPFKNLHKDVQNAILYGCSEQVWGKQFEGVIPNLERLFKTTDSDYLKEEISKYMSQLPCPACGGTRLKPETLAVKISGKNISQIAQMSVKACYDFFDKLELSKYEINIAAHILKEIKARFLFMKNVGLDYLTLDRISSTLSGGEAQRIRLATQIGAGLVGVLYILDEPSIGLHQRDNDKLLNTLIALRDLGNTLLVVEHDEATMRASDYIIDLGPGAGKDGGHVVAQGSFNDILKSRDSLTGKYLRGELRIAAPTKRRTYSDKNCLEITGAREHNLKNIDVKIPLGLFVGVSGVSGSGKSTLIDEILYRALAKKFYKAKEHPGLHSKIKGTEFIDKVIVIDQSPIGRTPRSNPITYTGAFSHIRDLYSRLPEARMRGFKAGRFSFNVSGGRCDACLGDGIKKIEMHFLPDVYVTCEVCKGKRFNQQTLEVKFKGKSIADVLEMTVDEGLAVFENIPAIKTKLKTLSDVGLGYIQLGQSATTLSGGEAQRIKLTRELSKRATGKTLYILDEPTTGLHFADVAKLLQVLNLLVEAGNTVLVIEHNLDVLKCADYLIDLGPEGGDDGGRVVGCGSPEEILKFKESQTARYLRTVLNV